MHKRSVFKKSNFICGWGRICHYEAVRLAFIEVCHWSFVGMTENGCWSLQRDLITESGIKISEKMYIYIAFLGAYAYFSLSLHDQSSLICASDGTKSKFESGCSLKPSVKVP